MNVGREVTDPLGVSTGWLLVIVACSWVVFVAAWIFVALFNPLVTDNRPRRDLTLNAVDPQI
jgi:hypothetical protein